MSSGQYKNTPNFKFKGEPQPFMIRPMTPMPAAPARMILDEPPPRSEEDKARRKKMIDNFIPVKTGAAMVLRHRTKNKTGGGLWKPAEAQDAESRRKVTGTIIKLPKTYEGELVVGDYVYFTEYAPFSAWPDFPEVQLIHVDDVLATMKELPDDVDQDD